ncbi:HAMP domain-containing histidine kinase [Streptomycetaceae bacterium NBC_01309]
MTAPPRRRSLGIRARLFAGFAVLLTAAAALMAFVVFTGLQFVPSYSTTIVVPSPEGGSVVPATPATPTTPVPTAPPAESDPGEPLVPGQHFPGAVMPGAKVSSTSDVRSTVLTATTVGIGLVLVTGLTAGWFVTRRLLTPLRAVSEAAAQVAEGDLHHRIHARGAGDELTNLADWFDTMTARLEQSFGAHRRFAANASHELLTPLATTRTILQLLDGTTSHEEFRELLPMLVGANDRSIAIVRSLLQLADAENARLDLRPVDLGALVARTADEYAAQARERGVRLDARTEADCAVEADAVLLRQLVANLIENGLAHNVAGGHLRMTVRRTDGTVVLEAANTGPHVEDEVAGRLFEPFYRARARSRAGADAGAGGDDPGVGEVGGPGHGLGLSIVQAITRAHDGSVDATANPGGGITVRVELPTRPAA